MSPTDRFLVLKKGTPVFTSNDPHETALYMWGRSSFTHSVYDYERPVKYPCGSINCLGAHMGDPVFAEGHCCVA